MRLDHVVIPVADAGRSLAYYGDILGLPLIAAHEGPDWGGRPWLMMIFGLSDGREVVLVASRGAIPQGHGLGAADLRHYAFSVETREAHDAWRERLVTSRVAFWEEDHGDQVSLYFPDPDGTILEITCPPTGAPTQPSPEALQRVKAWIAAGEVLTA